ncbi:MAG: ParM/StbA family protein [Proteobacteria bacterium]|nr:ParM/StbA family protein [Pseudomonadota bacterium]MBU1387329.1 ParM/StbA family protein [Pseudomonadota bacterium]MBU1544312.1 ParM/StbA family protein [Pseudomonadota bacterium]MBU2480956.1 ParM/StbA family protein [Pseudomonadota bacterium]
MEIIGIDVGFGFTKAYNGKNSVIFKSLIGDATDIQFRSLLGDDLSSESLHITLDDKSYFLGTYAELQSNIREFTLDQDKLIEDFVKILAIAAAGICTDTAAPINVVSGLPVGYLKRDSKKLKDMIRGTHEITFHNSDGKDVTRRIQIDKIHVIPQPIGSIFNLIFDDQGRIRDKALATQKIGVVDIGFKTTDFSIFDHLQYIERGSSTMDTGISKCFSVIANKLRQESNISIELFRMYKFIESGMVKIRGKEYNISNLKKRVYSHAASAIASDLNRLWENDWDIDSIILSGGGSIELSEYLSPNIEGNVIPIPHNIDARFNNVMGYCKFGRYKWGYSKFISEAAQMKKAADDPAQKNEETDPAAADDKASAEKQSKGLAWLRRQN